MYFEYCLSIERPDCPPKFKMNQLEYTTQAIANSSNWSTTKRSWLANEELKFNVADVKIIDITMVMFHTYHVYDIYV